MTKQEVLGLVNRMVALSRKAVTATPAQRASIRQDLNKLAARVKAALPTLPYGPETLVRFQTVLDKMPLTEAVDPTHMEDMTKLELRQAITKLETQRDMLGSTWHTPQYLELRDLKDELERRYGRPWKSEAITIPVEKGDTILVGKWKNHPIKVKTFSKDDHDMPTVNGRKVVNFRIPKEQPTEEGMHITRLTIRALIEAELAEYTSRELMRWGSDPNNRWGDSNFDPNTDDATWFAAKQKPVRETSSNDCPECSGAGWYAEGPTDEPKQVRCERCRGTGKTPIQKK